MKNKILVSGAVLAGMAAGFAIENCLKAKPKELEFYNGNLGYARAVYNKGFGEKPDVLEVYFNDMKSCPSGMEYALPIAEIYNDYDKDGTIGNDPRDRYVIMFGSVSDVNKAFSHKVIGDYATIQGVGGDCRRIYSTIVVHKKQEGHDDYHLRDATGSYQKYMRIINENSGM